MIQLVFSRLDIIVYDLLVCETLRFSLGMVERISAEDQVHTSVLYICCAIIYAP